MQLTRKYNKGICFFFMCCWYFNDILSWLILLKDKKRTESTNGSQKVLDKYKLKPNRISVVSGTEIYNRTMELWLEKK